jgi:zeta-carotene desaturase
VVVSASRSLVEMPAADVAALAVRELAEYLPPVQEAKLLRHVVVKEARATFSARPRLEAERPSARTGIDGLYLAGDWTRTGWPATMEGAVRSGYLAAEALTADAGAPKRYLIDGLPERSPSIRHAMQQPDRRSRPAAMESKTRRPQHRA